jgi:hypothetical protein
LTENKSWGEYPAKVAPHPNGEFRLFVVVEQEIHGDSSHNRREEKNVTDKYVCVQDCLSYVRSHQNL